MMRSSMLATTFALALGCSSNSNDNGGSAGGSNHGGSCVSLCSHTNTASGSEQLCVEQRAYAMGYDWPHDPVCNSIVTSADCEQCAANLAMAQGDCGSLESTCFGGGSPGSGGGGGLGGSGATGAGGGGSVSTCAELCTHAPGSTPTEQHCVETQSYAMGYDWSQQAVCAAANTSVGCNACTATLAMKDGDCASIYAQCF